MTVASLKHLQSAATRRGQSAVPRSMTVASLKHELPPSLRASASSRSTVDDRGLIEAATYVDDVEKALDRSTVDDRGLIEASPWCGLSIPRPAVPRSMTVASLKHRQVTGFLAVAEPVPRSMTVASLKLSLGQLFWTRIVCRSTVDDRGLIEARTVWRFRQR